MTGSKTILERWHDDGKYRKSLSDVGWTEEQIIQYDAIALEDHSYVASWQEGSRNGKSWNISNAKDCVTNIQQSLEMETNQSLLDNNSGNGLINNFVNSCAHSLVVLVLCVFGTCRAFLVPAEVFFSHGVLMLIFRVHPCLFA